MDITEMHQLRDNLRSKQSSITANGHQIGDYTYGIKNVLEWGEGAKLKVGKFCSIAEGVTFMLGGNHRTDWITTYPFNKQMKGNFGHICGHPATKGGIVIGNDVWIGRNATILSGVTIGDGAVIGAESVVAKDVPAYSVVVGNPAEAKKYRFAPGWRTILLDMKWWDWDDELVMRAVPILMQSKIPKLFDFYMTEVRHEQI